MTVNNTPAGQLLLRAQGRSKSGSETISRDFRVPEGVTLRLGREARMAPSVPGFNPERGADLVFPDDDHISNNHARVTWDGTRLHVVQNPQAKNQIYILDSSVPEVARPEADFYVSAYERFRIGNTVFTLLPDTGPIERTMSGEELRHMGFVDPTPRIEALAALPELIRLSPDEATLEEELLRVVLRGVPRADVAALVAIPPDAVEESAGVRIKSVQWRFREQAGFKPSRQLVYRSLRGFENVRYIWTDNLQQSAMGAPSWDGPTIGAGTDWAVCVRLLGSVHEGLYLAGRLGAELALTSERTDAPQLNGDMKFIKLAGDIFSGLRELRQLQNRESFLAQILSPVLRNAVQDRSLEELTRPQELITTVLFCDLRGFTSTVQRGEQDLLGTWKTLSEALDEMTRAIVAQDGVIGDFQGDAAMGFWGWPLPQADQIDRAAKAALEIRRRFSACAKVSSHPLAGLACGVGIAHGPAVAGKLGTFDQIKIGVFGPVVNRASRLEAATKALQVPILIDEAVAKALTTGRPWCRIRRLARVVPKGLADPVLIAELLPPELDRNGPNMTESNRQLYEAALTKFLNKDWSGFRMMVKSLPNDGPVEFISRFIDRPEHVGGKPPPDWNGGIPVEK
ncbi:MAG: adenylate/guanylate cyclase domain-containing protein [Bacteroidales bacterium]|nr:adenylate/guanylate cyclase domain-containing protein [Bacteroidales bacterium]